MKSMWIDVLWMQAYGARSPTAAGVKCVTSVRVVDTDTLKHRHNASRGAVFGKQDPWRCAKRLGKYLAVAEAHGPQSKLGSGGIDDGHAARVGARAAVRLQRVRKTCETPARVIGHMSLPTNGEKGS